jgi:hypothetical protein
MFGWQNNLALSRTGRGEWKRLNSERRKYYTVQNLFNTKLACYVVLQLTIYFLALGFAIRVQIEGQLLPSVLAQIAMDMPHTTSYVITLIATVISFLNTLCVFNSLLITEVLSRSYIPSQSAGSCTPSSPDGTNESTHVIANLARKSFTHSRAKTLRPA